MELFRVIVGAVFFLLAVFFWNDSRKWRVIWREWLVSFEKEKKEAVEVLEVVFSTLVKKEKIKFGPEAFHLDFKTKSLETRIRFYRNLNIDNEYKGRVNVILYGLDNACGIEQAVNEFFTHETEDLNLFIGVFNNRMTSFRTNLQNARELIKELEKLESATQETVDIAGDTDKQSFGVVGGGDKYSSHTHTKTDQW